MALGNQELLFGRFTAIAGGGLSLSGLWLTALAIVLWAGIFPGALLTFRNAWTLREVGTRHLAISPWAVERGLPIARFGLRTLALWLAVPVLLVVVAAAVGAASPSVAAWTLVLNVAGAFFSLLVPASGLHGNIRRAKQAERDRIDRAIEGEAGAMDDSVLGPEGRTLDRLRLVQWRRELDAFREWPIDAPVLRRVALFVVLPVLSWVAAALVESGLDTFLTR